MIVPAPRCPAPVFDSRDVRGETSAQFRRICPTRKGCINTSNGRLPGVASPLQRRQTTNDEPPTSNSNNARRTSNHEPSRWVHSLLVCGELAGGYRPWTSFMLRYSRSSSLRGRIPVLQERDRRSGLSHYHVDEETPI